MARSVPITIDKPRKLRFTIAALEALEIELGFGLKELFRREQEVRALVLLVHYGLQWEDPTLTREAVHGHLQNIVDADGDLSQIYARAVQALLASGVLGKEAAVEARAALARPSGAVEPTPAADGTTASASGSTTSSPAPSATLG